MNTFAKFDAAVGALVVIAVVAVTQVREPAPPAPRSPAPSLSPRPAAPAPPNPTPEPEGIPLPSGPPETWGFPAAGELSPGWYVAKVIDVSQSGDGYALGFNLETSGWRSGGADAEGYGGMITKGAVTSPDGAVIRFSSPDRVYTDPCAHTQGPALGHSAEELAGAMAAIPGVKVNGPTETQIGSSRDYPTIAQHLDLSIGAAPACGPGEDGFYLWFNERAGPLTGPRWVTSLDSTIGVWVFHQESRYGFPRIVIDAETFAGATIELRREIREIVDSIIYYGG